MSMENKNGLSTDRARSKSSNGPRSPTAINDNSTPPGASTNNATSPSIGVPPPKNTNTSGQGAFFPSSGTSSTVPSAPTYTPVLGQKTSTGGATPFSRQAAGGNRHPLHAPGSLQGSGSPNNGANGNREGGFFARATRHPNSGGGALNATGKGSSGAGIGSFRDPSSPFGSMLSRVAGTGEGNGNNSSSSSLRLPSFGLQIPHRNVTSSPNPDAPQNFTSSNLGSPCGSPASPVNLDDIPVPEDCIYDVETFLLFDHAAQQESQGPSSPPPQESSAPTTSSSLSARMICPPGIMQIVRRLWKSMPEHMDQLIDSGNLRDRLFAEEKAQAPSKVLHERKIHHEVMGIMGKVTESNLEAMQRSLLALPIRQSTKEEIKEVINVFFSKSTQPEDSRYTPLYVNLIVYLIDNIGSSTGEMIRKEIIAQCKENFMSQKQEKNLEESIADMTEEEAEMERMKHAAKQKANIYFLGLMFANKLITETIICSVLDDLIRPRTRRQRYASESNLVSFMELLQTCGPYLNTNSEERLREYRELIEFVMTTHPKIRLRVLFQNLLETVNNNWVPLHGRMARRDNPPQGSPTGLSSPLGGLGASPVTPSSPLNVSLPAAGNFLKPGQAGGVVGGSGGAAGMGGLSPSVGGVGAAGTAGSLMSKTNARGPAAGDTHQEAGVETREEFWRAVDDCFSTWKVREEKRLSEELKSMMQHRLPPELVLPYCTSAIGRYIYSVRCEHERMHLGKLFQEMINENLLTVEVAQKAIHMTMETAIEEDYVTDLPRYFNCWSTVTRYGGSVFPPSLNTSFLSCMVEHHCSPQVIQRFIDEVDTFVDLEGREGGSSSASAQGGGKTVINSSNSKNGTTSVTAGSGALHGSSSMTTDDEIVGGRGGSVEDRLHDRLRLLPSVLRCTPPLLCDETTAQEFQDPLLQLGAQSIEVKAFRILLEDSASIFSRWSTRVIKENLLNALPLISALFTFIRFDLEQLFDRFKTTIKKICNAPNAVPLVVLMEEVYLQWSGLDAPLGQFSLFYEKIKSLFPNERQIDERLREKLQKTCPPSDNRQKVLTYLKAPSVPPPPSSYSLPSSGSVSNVSSNPPNGVHVATTAAGAASPPARVSSPPNQRGHAGALLNRNEGPNPMQGSPVKSGTGTPLPAPPSYPSHQTANIPGAGFRNAPATHQQSNSNSIRTNLPPPGPRLAPPPPPPPAPLRTIRGGREGRNSSSPHNLYTRNAHSPPSTMNHGASMAASRRGGGIAPNMPQDTRVTGQSGENTSTTTSPATRMPIASPPPPPPTSTTTTTTVSNSATTTPTPAHHSPPLTVKGTPTGTGVTATTVVGGRGGSGSLNPNKKEKRRAG